jgi:hypothetical protein
MVATARIERVWTLNTDHSPFVMMLERTAEVLIEQINGFERVCATLGTVGGAFRVAANVA